MISKIKKRIDKNQYLKIDNIKIYFSFAILSIIFILISNIFNYEILKILKNISYSILAATLMAYFIDCYHYLKICPWNLYTSQLSSIQLSALIPAFMQVWSKNSSTLNPFSGATCGKSNPLAYPF